METAKTFTIEFFGGRDYHDVYIDRWGAKIRNNRVTAKTAQEALEEHIRVMGVYGWVGTVQVAELDNTTPWRTRGAVILSAEVS